MGGLMLNASYIIAFPGDQIDIVYPHRQRNVQLCRQQKEKPILNRNSFVVHSEKSLSLGSAHTTPFPIHRNNQVVFDIRRPHTTQHNINSINLTDQCV